MSHESHMKVTWLLRGLTPYGPGPKFQHCLSHIRTFYWNVPKYGSNHLQGASTICKRATQRGSTIPRSSSHRAIRIRLRSGRKDCRCMGIWRWLRASFRDNGPRSANIAIAEFLAFWEQAWTIVTRICNGSRICGVENFTRGNACQL